MSVVTLIGAARMLAIEAASIVSGAIVGDNLVLTRFDGQTITAGNVRGPKGDTGPDGTFVSEIKTFATLTPPNSNWMVCDARELSRTTYSELFSKIGTSFGAGNGTTTFNIPGSNGRAMYGYDATQTEFNAVGKTGGSKTSTAPHTHGINHDHPSFTSGAGSPHTHSYGETGNNGGSTYMALGGGYYYNYASFNVSNESAHTHPVDVPAFTGTSGVSSAEATSGNLPPYFTGVYMIRVI